MKSTYTIEGMTCNGCVNTVKGKLARLPEVEEVNIDLSSKRGEITFTKPVSLEKLQAILGKYKISELSTESRFDLPEKSISTYKPLILIILFIFGVTFLAQYPFQDFSAMTWMRHFMAGFFIVFAFFKMLNVSGFAESYQMYDIIAARWKGWGFIYPYVELGLGIAYLINFNSTITNWATIIILGISSIGVITSVLNKQKIKCACLGDVFNLPMSTVTIVEDLTMVGMAAMMMVL